MSIEQTIFSLNKLKEFLSQKKEPAYRFNQILLNIFLNRNLTFLTNTTLPSELRNGLEELFSFEILKLKKESLSGDGTRKYLFELNDGASIESALIPGPEYSGEECRSDRITLCISTQAGCALDCAFCATGKLKFKRNLTVEEIVFQIINVEKITGEKITNVVLMGMGEPLLNYENVASALRILTKPEYQLLKARKITLSTAGYTPGLRKLIEDTTINKKIKLALSLHAVTQAKRQKIMPVALKYDLTELYSLLELYYQKTRLPITYEYIVFDGFNNQSEDARLLAKLSRRIPSKVNLIPFHDISFTGIEPKFKLKPASAQQINDFKKLLINNKVKVFTRTSSGNDINAACGQLALSSR